MRTSKKTALIVDDEDDLREVMVQLFSAEYRILEARNGKDALEILKSERVDFVLSDIRMPGGDGLELLQKVKTELDYQPLFILMSAFYVISEAAALELGCHALFQKPFDILYLEKFVDNYFKKQNL